MATTIDQNALECDPAGIPDRYVVIIGPGKQCYVVPQFMVPALHQMFDGYRKKQDMEVFRAAGSVHDFNGSGFGIIGEGKIMAPAIPGSSDWERLSAHAEVLALQERLGISYKDASHRLYMAELERLKSDEKMHKAFANLQVLTEQALERAYNSIKQAETRDTSPDMAGAADGDVVGM
ncbi:hypothetical protein BYT27DRAFT_7254402 [Phlegmacium glaucopus]|nr:hypothetical protein BYT27DRAFT_7254402 [Phlegmacium glaucopus]